MSRRRSSHHVCAALADAGRQTHPCTSVRNLLLHAATCCQPSLSLSLLAAVYGMDGSAGGRVKKHIARKCWLFGSREVKGKLCFALWIRATLSGIGIKKNSSWQQTGYYATPSSMSQCSLELDLKFALLNITIFKNTQDYYRALFNYQLKNYVVAVRNSYWTKSLATAMCKQNMYNSTNSRTWLCLNFS